MEKQLLQFIKQSEKILVTSHISPDPDAVSSLLLMGLTLKKNFPDKQVTLILEEEAESLNFLEGYGEIEYSPLIGALKNYHPDLFILLDGNNYERCSRHNGQEVRKFLQSNSVKTVVIDHHELAGADKVGIYINREYPATVQEIYEICFKDLNLNKPKGFAQIAMLGLFADTGGFVYMKAGRHSEVFSFADELVANSANIEHIKNLLSSYSESDMQVLSELTANISHQDDYTYSYIRDEFIRDWLQAGKTAQKLHTGTKEFVDAYIRNVDGRKWGFIVYRNTLQGENIYSVSFRALGGVKDVAQLAAKLGGGGHKPAAGAKIEADSVGEAIQKVQQAISESVN